jgi:putative sporulation protein YyaC
MRNFLKKTHPNSPILAIDAAVGEKGDVGVIRVTDSPLFPGAGANKQLGCLGDVSILGIVAEKSATNYGILNTTRLNLVYTMAEIISDGVSTLLWERAGKKSTLQNA